MIALASLVTILSRHSEAVTLEDRVLAIRDREFPFPACEDARPPGMVGDLSTDRARNEPEPGTRNPERGTRNAEPGTPPA
jgi:hypothetical protein